MMVKDTKRLFVGIPLPETLLKELSSFQKKYFHVETVRWTKPENLHVTLFFIGEVPELLLPAATKKLQIIFASTPPFQLKWEQLCFFPEKKPRMIWVKFGDHEAFSRLSSQISDAISGIIKLEKEEKESIPHITLARFKKLPATSSMGEGNKINLNFTVQNQLLEVKDAILWESELRQEGAVYRRLQHFFLASE